MIEIKNEYIEMIGNSAIVQGLVKKTFTAKTSFWLATIFGKIEEISKIYFAEKKKLIDRYAKLDKDGKIIEIENMSNFNKDLKALMDIKSVLSVEKIKYNLDEEPACSIEEMGLLLSFIEVESCWKLNVISVG